MSNIPAELKYTKDHEWAKLEGDIVTVGITDFAQNSLGDIVYVELPNIGDNIEKEGTFGVVESIKSASDLYSPLTGEIVEVNEDLNDSPDLLNEDAYTNWIMKIKISNEDEFNSLLSASDYKPLCEE
ncbi:MAG: glycine cleavage system protein H [Halobacteriovorax sp.]|nr:glycine cleavage system protein H [Halobacteriovorax sp.]|tara:strand:- start:2063 stop:2443 length:381 start_codon:yes stop_codon:yes gene_type:complete